MRFLGWDVGEVKLQKSMNAFQNPGKVLATIEKTNLVLHVGANFHVFAKLTI